MFLRFGFANHGSFRAPTEVSFLARNLNDDVHSPFPEIAHAKNGVLPIIAIYGANASGKSNTLHAITRMIAHVVSSFSLRPSQKIPWRPHKLAQETMDEPSRFDCDVVVKGVRYHYGFTCKDESFIEEWIYAWPDGSKQLWFYRNGKEWKDWYFGPGFKGEKRRIAQQTRHNCLFLSVAAQFNHAQLLPLYQCFEENTMRGEPDATEFAMWSDSPFFQEDKHNYFLSLLRSADIGISDFSVKNEKEMIEKIIKESIDNNQKDFAEEMKKKLEEEGEPKRLVLSHTGADGFVAQLEPNEESDGTISLMNRLHEIIESLLSGRLLIIDEIDRSLHPHLCAELLKLFGDFSVNTRGAQILFATHDTSLLDCLRRDEVYLTDKDIFGASTLRRMADFKLLKREDMQRVYNEGRVGGIPRLGDFHNVLTEVCK